MSAFESFKTKFNTWQGADDESDDFEEEAVTRRDTPATTSQNSAKIYTCNVNTVLQLVVKRPEKYSDAADIAELYKNKTTVIIMFNNTNKDIANRLIDFLGGVSYITDGELKRIGETTYVLAPYNVDISGEFIEEINNISGSDDIFDTID